MTMQTVTSSDGTTIAYDRTGDGPPLILIGGAMTTRQASAEIAGALGGQLTVYAYDRRGRGDSGDTQPYAVEREVEDIAALVEATGGQAALFGHSSGGALAFEAALAGVPVAAIAVYEPPFLIDPGHPPLARDYRARQQAHLAAGRRGDAIEQFMLDAVMVPPEMVDGMRRSPMWPSMESIAHTLPYDQAVIDRTPLDVPDPLSRFASIQVPVLTIAGGSSPRWLRRPAEELARILPNARHVTLEGQSHGADTAVLAPVLIEFFASVAGEAESTAGRA